MHYICERTCSLFWDKCKDGFSLERLKILTIDGLAEIVRDQPPSWMIKHRWSCTWWICTNLELFVALTLPHALGLKAYQSCTNPPSKENYSQVLEFISGLPVLVHWYVFLFLCPWLKEVGEIPKSVICRSPLDNAMESGQWSGES